MTQQPALPTSRLAKSSIAGKRLSNIFDRLGAAIILVAMLAAFSIFNPSFARPDNLMLILLTGSIIGIVAIGQTIAIISGGIDLSVGSVLALAGGISPNGSDIVTLLSPHGANTEKHDYDLPDLLLKGQGSGIKINANDIIYVPHAPMYYIYGEVQRPGQFHLERNMTVAQALAAGGGLTMRGTERGRSIKRRNAAGVLETIEAKADDLLDKDDVLYIRESLF